MKKNEDEIINYINNLKEYQGYVQFSHRPIDKAKDIFYNNKTVKVDDEDGFIYEAHFCNNVESISIKQLNDFWMISTTDIQKIKTEDTQTYLTDIESLQNIKMAQIWEEREDEFCEGMKVKKLQKVVFVGFEKGETK
ncbi:MAG: TIGR04423 family type III CRISPR-associated protein [Campylobacterota bacterium]|nr:TIGR04423 family type III CRISPR-associated protein [Campylobacterota bacterium]